MVIIVPALVALAALSTTGTRGAPAPSPTLRYDAGATASVTVRARIVRASARVGPNFAAPLSRMAPRRTTVSAADGRPVAALVYDFE